MDGTVEDLVAEIGLYVRALGGDPQAIEHWVQKQMTSLILWGTVKEENTWE